MSYWKSTFHPAGSNSLPHSFSPPGRPRGFKLRLPLLRSLSNSKASLNDAEAGDIPTATPLPLHPDHHSHESLCLGEFLPLPTLPPDHQEPISGSRLARWISLVKSECLTFLERQSYETRAHHTISQWLHFSLIMSDYVYCFHFTLPSFLFHM